MRLVPVSAAAARGEQQQETRGNFDVRCRSTYLLGENTNHNHLDDEYRPQRSNRQRSESSKVRLSRHGNIRERLRTTEEAGVYDGTWDFPKEPVKAAAPGEVREWLLPRKREPRFVQLSPGQSTELELDLAAVPIASRRRRIPHDDHSRRWTESGQGIRSVFRRREERRHPWAALKSKDDAERLWSVANLVKFDRPQLVALLEEMVRSGNESQREFAAHTLAQIRAGTFDRLKLRVDNKDGISKANSLFWRSQ